MARILQVCNTDFYLARFLAPLVRALVAAGHHVECACEGTRLEGLARELGVTVHQLGFPRAASPLGFARCIASLGSLIRARGYDCVNSHNRNASIAARIAAWRERVPLNLYTAHGFYFHDDQPPLVREATISLEAALARITSFTLSQTEEDLRLMVSRGLIAPGRIAWIGNGITTARFRCRGERAVVQQTLGLRPCFRVAAVGRIVKAKGFLDLLEAFALMRGSGCRDAELLLIGGNIVQDISPVRNEFHARVRALGIEHAVTVTGMVDNVEEYLAASDVFVLPSYREGLSRALLEAMSMELTVIATAIRGCREVVEHGRNGFLYPAGDVARLASLLSLVYEHPALRRRLGQKARATVVERFDERDYVNRQVEAIERLLSTRGLGARAAQGTG